MTLEELRKKREEQFAKAKAVQAAAEAADRDMTPEEESGFNAALAETEALDKRIKRMATLGCVAETLDAPLPTRTAGAVNVVTTGSDDATVVDVHSGQWRVKQRAEDDPTWGWRSFGEYATALMTAYTPGHRVLDERLYIGAAATGMSQGTGADGGFLVPPVYSTKIWDGLNATADNLLGRTDQYTIEGESLTFNANAETSRATGSRFGGVRGYWIAEADQITASKTTFRQIRIEPQELAVLIYATDKLIRNSAVALEQYLTRAATEEINFLVGDSIINGTGAGQPLGLLNHISTAGCVVSVAKETGQAAATINHTNIVKMFSRGHARSRANMVWLINQDIEPQLNSMTLGVGASGLPVYLPPGGLSDAPYGALLGRPVIPIEYCATIGTVGDIILADLRAYVTGTRGGVNSAMSIHLRFDYAETAFRFMFAVDGKPWLASALTPYKGASNTVSPFVVLATRA